MIQFSSSFWQRSASFWQRSVRFWQRSASFWQRSVRFWQRSASFWQRSASCKWNRTDGCTCWDAGTDSYPFYALYMRVIIVNGVRVLPRGTDDTMFWQRSVPFWQRSVRFWQRSASSGQRYANKAAGSTCKSWQKIACQETENKENSIKTLPKQMGNSDVAAHSDGASNVTT